MPPLQKTPVSLMFGSVDQRSTGKSLPPGRPTVAENVYQSQTKSYVKRNGFTRLGAVTDTGTIFGSQDLTTTGTALVHRTSDSVYVRSNAAGKWLKKGTFQAAPVTYQLANTGQGDWTESVVENGRRWIFSATAVSTGGTYSWSVYDEASGVEISAPQQVTATKLVQGRIVVAAGSVWFIAGVMSGASINAMNCYKFNPSTPAAAPALTTLQGSGFSGTFEGMDVHTDGSGTIVVATVGSSTYGVNGALGKIVCTKVDTSTGLAVFWTASSPNGANDILGPVNFLKDEVGGTGSFYFLARPAGSTAIGVYTLNLSSLGATQQLITGSNTHSGTTSYCGYRDNISGNFIVFSNDPTVATSTVNVCTRWVWTGSVATSSIFCRGEEVISEPFGIYDNQRYVLTTHQDDASSTLRQAAYQVRDATTGRIVARAMYGLAGGLFQRPAIAPTGIVKWDYGHILPVQQPTYFTIVANGSVSAGLAPLATSTYIVNVKLASSAIGNSITYDGGDKILIPGGWPTVLAGEGSLLDLGTELLPARTGATRVATGGFFTAGVYGFCTVYTITDRLGTVYRSAPSIADSLTLVLNDHVNIVAPSLRLLNADPSLTVNVEYYCTGPGANVYRQVAVKANDPTVDILSTVTLTDSSAQAGATYEILYTDGAVLDNAPIPPWTVGAYWKNRIFLAGTDSMAGDVWPSKELQPGIGPSFNEQLIFRISEGTGDCTAVGAVDEIYFAIFKADGVWLISGQGPDDAGHGGYSPVRVPDAPGCTNPKSLVQMPQGLMYQSVDGTLWLISRGGAGVWMGQGVDSYRTATINDAVHWPERNLVVFGTRSGSIPTMLVWDYGNPLPAEGSLGQWYAWKLPATGANITGLTVQQGALYYSDGGGNVYQETPGQYYDHDTNGTPTVILRKVKLPIVLSGVRGFQRVYRGQVVGQFAALHSLKVTYETYSGVAGEAGSTSQSWTKVVSAGPELAEFKPDAGKETAFDLTIEDVGTDQTAGASLDGIGLEVGIKAGLPRLNSGQRF
jgi:hypothetical protein